MDWNKKNELTETITRAILMGYDEYTIEYEHLEGTTKQILKKKVALPSPQRTGTLMQQETYARMTAMVIVDRFAKEYVL